MRSGSIAWGLVLVSACSAFSGGDDDAPASPDGPAADAASDGQSGEGDGAPPGLEDAAAPLRCNPTAPFGDPVKVELADTFAYANTPRLLPDERTLLFGGRPSEGDQTSLYVATRVSADGTFSKAQPVALEPAADAGFDETDGWMAPDGLTLYFASKRHLSDPGTFFDVRFYNFDLYRATRPASSGPFTSVVRLSTLSSETMDTAPSLVESGALGVFMSARDSYADGGVGRKRLFQFSVSASGALGTPSPLRETLRDDEHVAPALSADGLRLYFGYRDPTTKDAPFVMVYADRPSTTAEFGLRADVLASGRAAPPDNDLPGWISPDDCRLYFSRGAGAKYALYMTERGK